MNKYAHSFLVIGFFLFFWQAFVIFFQCPNYILPTPLAVMHAMQQHAALLAMETLPTMVETLLGFLCGIMLGCSVALLMVFIRPLAFCFLPLIIISQAIPVFAIAPILVIWFGYGIGSKLIMTTIMIFFPITSAFYDGLCNTNEHWLNLAKIMQAKKWRTFWLIRIPAAFPQLASGLRVSAVIAPIGAIIGEWVGASRGLGFLMLDSNARMQIDLMFAALFILIGFSLTLYYLVDWGLRRIRSI